MNESVKYWLLEVVQWIMVWFTGVIIVLADILTKNFIGSIIGSSLTISGIYKIYKLKKECYDVWKFNSK